MSETTPNTEPKVETGVSAQSDKSGNCRRAACEGSSGSGRCGRGGPFRKIIAIIVLVSIGVFIGRGSAHHDHHGPWSYGPHDSVQVTTGQSMPMNKLLDGIGATPEQRQKAETAIHGQ